MWKKPSDYSSGEMKVMLQCLADYHECGGCTDTMYKVFEDMLVNLIQKRESLKRFA